MNFADQLEADAKAQFKPPTDEELKSVADLAYLQLYLEDLNRPLMVEKLVDLGPSVPELEEALRLKKLELTKVKEFDLPKAVEQFGLSEFKLLNGDKVMIKEEVYAAITEANKPSAFAWLKETGNQDLIKSEVKLPFTKGQSARVQELTNLLDKYGFSYSESQGVHPQTLKAFVRRRIEAGQPMPTDVFSIHVKKIASIVTKR